jgi:hypothetical protein
MAEPDIFYFLSLINPIGKDIHSCSSITIYTPTKEERKKSWYGLKCWGNISNKKYIIYQVT